MSFLALLFSKFWAEAFQKVLIFFEILQCFFFGHVLSSQVGLHLQFLLDDGDLLVLLTGLCLCFFDGISSLLLVLSEVVIEVLHIFLKHLLGPL